MKRTRKQRKKAQKTEIPRSKAAGKVLNFCKAAWQQVSVMYLGVLQTQNAPLQNTLSVFM